MNEIIETYDIFIWDEEENEAWLWGTTHKTGEEREKLIERLKKEYETDVWAYLA